MSSETNAPAAPADPLSNFANLPFTSPDPSAVSLLWNAAHPFLTGEYRDDGILFVASSTTQANGSEAAAASPLESVIAPENAAVPADAAAPVIIASSVPNKAELKAQAREYLTAVSLGIDSLEMALRYSGMHGMGQQLMLGENGGADDSWNALLPQVVDVIEAVSIASALCRDEPHKITTSGILPTLLRLIDTIISVSSPPDLNDKLNKGSILNRKHEPTTHCLTPFHPVFLQCCILSQQFRYAQRFLQNHPVQTHLLILSSNNALTSNTNTPRFDTNAYLRFHYYAGFIHMKCEDWNSALSSFHLCLTVPCIGNSLNGISTVSIAARKKMLLIRCALLESDEMDGPTFGGTKGKSKKRTVENKVFEMPGAASQAMCRYMSNPSKRVDGEERSITVGPERGDRGTETGEERKEGGFHAMRRKHRHHASSSSESSPADRGPPLSSTQLKNIRQLGQYHDLVSTYITGISSHYTTLLKEMHDLLMTDGNWEMAKELEGRLAYRAAREIAATYSVIAMDSLEKTIRDTCGAPVQEMMSSRHRAEDALAGMMACEWEDVLVSDPFYAKMDQKTGVVTFVEDAADAVAREEEDTLWLDHDLSKRLESCIGFAERIRDLDIQLTISQKYQQQVAKWEVKSDARTKVGQGVADAGHSPMDIGGDW